jgi:hypothetical protein
MSPNISLVVEINLCGTCILSTSQEFIFGQFDRPSQLILCTYLRYS